MTVDRNLFIVFTIVALLGLALKLTGRAERGRSAPTGAEVQGPSRGEARGGLQVQASTIAAKF